MLVSLASMTAMNYDSKKMPLGKLSKATINQGELQNMKNCKMG